MGKIEAKEIRSYQELETFFKGTKGQEYRELNVKSNNSAVLPELVSDAIVKKMTNVSPIVGQVQTFMTKEGQLKIPIEQSVQHARFVEEGQSVNEEPIDLDHVKLEKKRVGSAFGITKNLVFDAQVDFVEYLKERLGRYIGLAIEDSIFNGNGNATSMSGILQNENVASVDGSASPVIDELNEMVNTVKPCYHNQAAFYINADYYKEVSQMKDESGRHYVTHAVINGAIQKILLGVPVFVTDSLPESNPVVFGSAADGYSMLIHQGASVQRISADGKNAIAGTELILADMYLDGSVTNVDALCKMTVSAT